MAGHDPRDSTSLDRPRRGLHARLSRERRKPLAGLRIGLPREYFGAGIDADVAAAIDAALAELRALGATTVDVALPNVKLSVPVYYVIAPAEASSNLSRFDGVRYGHRAAQYADLTDMYKKTRAEGFGAEVKRRILVGTYVLSHGYYDAYYLKAQQVRRLIADDFRARVRAVRRDHGPDGADGRVPDRRQDRRPGADVPERHLHRRGQPDRRAGDVDPLRLRPPTACRSGCSSRATTSPRRGCSTSRTATSRRPTGTARAPAGAPDDRGDRWHEVGSRHRPRDARAALDGVEDLLRRVDRVRRRAEHAGLRGRHRAARRAAGAEPRRGRARDPLRPRRRRDDQPRAACSRARTTSIPTCPRATRSASTRSRSSQGGVADRSPRRRARRPSGSPARTSRRTPASRCTRTSTA